MTEPNAASREARALVETIMIAEAEHTVRDMAGHVGEEVHGVLKRHAMLMKTTGGAIAVGVLAAIEVLHDTLEFACRSMDDDDERTQMATAIGTLFATQADARLRLALADEAASQPREWPDIGIDPMKGPRTDRLEQSIAACREAYVRQQQHVPDQTALVWRWHLGAVLETATRLKAILARDNTAPTDQAQGGEVERIQRALAELDGKEWSEHRRALHVAAALAQSGDPS